MVLLVLEFVSNHHIHNTGTLFHCIDYIVSYINSINSTNNSRILIQFLDQKIDNSVIAVSISKSLSFS